jgi:competence protein ComEA
MERLRRLIRNWLGFSRTEANGFMILLPLLFLIIISEPLYRKWAYSQEEDFSKEEKMLDSLVALWNSSPQQEIETEPQRVALIERFPFEPNKASELDLEKLGISKHLSKRIVTYRQKGGVFRVKSDLMKIYGMDSTLYRQLYAYIVLPEKVTKDEPQQFIVAKKPAALFDLNKADTAELKTIYGIGPVLAARIIKFRDKLGGFVKADQLKDVYGLDTTVYKRLTKASFIDQNFLPNKININTSDEIKLSSHPYISKSVAKAIVAYRFQHGNFSDEGEVRKISILTPYEAERLIPYVTVKD